MPALLRSFESRVKRPPLSVRTVAKYVRGLLFDGSYRHPSVTHEFLELHRTTLLALARFLFQKNESLHFRKMDIDLVKVFHINNNDILNDGHVYGMLKKCHNADTHRRNHNRDKE